MGSNGFISGDYLPSKAPIGGYIYWSGSFFDGALHTNYSYNVSQFAQDYIFLIPEGIEIFSRAMRERILEIHHYVELDKNRYTFLYAADQQIKSLIRSFEALDPAEYVSSYTGGGKDGLL